MDRLSRLLNADHGDREQAASDAIKLLAVAMVKNYLMDEVAEIASWDRNVTKKQTVAVARCLKTWALNDFSRKPKKK